MRCKRSPTDPAGSCWAGVEGTLLIGDKPAARETVKIAYDDLWGRDPSAISADEQAARRIFRDYQTQTDEKGQFVFERVQPGKAKICHYVKVSQEGAPDPRNHVGPGEGHRPIPRVDGIHFRRLPRHGGRAAAHQAARILEARRAVGRLVVEELEAVRLQRSRFVLVRYERRNLRSFSTTVSHQSPIDTRHAGPCPRRMALPFHL